MPCTFLRCIYWYIINWAIRSMFQWNSIRISNIYIQQKYTFYSMHLKLLSAKHRPLHSLAKDPEALDSGRWILLSHNGDVIISVMASQITGVSSVCSTVCSNADQRKHQSSASLAFLKGIHRSPVDSPQRPVARKMFSFDDVIMGITRILNLEVHRPGSIPRSVFCINPTSGSQMSNTYPQQ